MTQDQLEAVIAMSGHERYRILTAEDNPDKAQRDGYREHVRKLAEAAAANPAPRYPSLASQAVRLAGSAVQFVASGLAVVDRDGYERRRAVCKGCPTNRYDAEQDRCLTCACHLSIKPWGKSEKCPDGHW